MQLLYVGFEQAKNVRQYIFHGITQGAEPCVFVMSTDMALFQELHLGLQEGPIMCLRTLAADLESLGPAQSPASHRSIHEKDVRAYLVGRAAPPGKKGVPKRPRPENSPALKWLK